MPPQRYFTEAELKELGANTRDLVIKAIDAGDTEKARKLVNRMYGELLAMHDLETTMVTAAMSFIGKRFGDKVLEEALHEMLGSWVKQAARDYAKVDSPKRQAQMFAYGLKGHGEPLTVEEDDEKFIFTMQPCGSGGKLVRQGSYGPPRDFYTVQKPQLMTYGKKDWPAYCAHCIFHEIVGIEETGVPLFVLAPPDKPGEQPCQMLLYKNPKDIPAKYYERAGKKKPT